MASLSGSGSSSDSQIGYGLPAASSAQSASAMLSIPEFEQPADALTKSVDKVKVTLFRQLMLGS